MWKMRYENCLIWNIVRNTEKREKWKMHTVGPGIWQKTEIGGKWDPHTLGTGIWWETVEMWKKCEINTVGPGLK